MHPDKIKKWKEDRETAIDFYRNTNMSIAQISRFLKRSPATVDKMITGKGLPRFITDNSLCRSRCTTAIIRR